MISKSPRFFWGTPAHACAMDTRPFLLKGPGYEAKSTPDISPHSSEHPLPPPSLQHGDHPSDQNWISLVHQKLRDEQSLLEHLSEVLHGQTHGHLEYFIDLSDTFNNFGCCLPWSSALCLCVLTRKVVEGFHEVFWVLHRKSRNSWNHNAA